MFKNLHSVLVSLFIATIVLFSSCSWNSSEKSETKETEEPIVVSETSDESSQTQEGETATADQKREEGEDLEKMDSKAGGVVAGGEVFTVVDKMPEYPGGEEALLKYLHESIVYPPYAKEQGVEGTVYVSFVVMPDGHVEKVKILKGIDEYCDAEAMRVVSEMPNWTPGYLSDETVMVEHNLPIVFSLSDMIE